MEYFRLIKSFDSNAKKHLMQAQFVTQLVYVRKIANVRYENRQFFSTNSRVSDESVSIIVLASEFCSTAASTDRNQQKCHEKIVTLICCCVARGTKNDDSKSVPKVLLIELSDFSIAVGMAITKLLRSQIRVLMNLLDDETVASCVFFLFLSFVSLIYIFFLYTLILSQCCNRNAVTNATRMLLFSKLHINQGNATHEFFFLMFYVFLFHELLPDYHV